MSHAAALNLEDFDSVQQAVLQTERGRWFLDEFARRNRQADTALVLRELDRMQHALGAIAPEENPEADVLAAIGAEVAALRPRKPGPVAQRLGDAIERNLEEVSYALSTILTVVGRLSMAMQREGEKPLAADELQKAIGEIEWACAFRDAFEERSETAGELVNEIDERLDHILKFCRQTEQSVTPQSAPQPAEQGSYQSRAEEMIRERLLAYPS